MYQLFNTVFHSKAEIKSYCMRLLNETPEGQHFTGEALGVLIELIRFRGGGKKARKEIKSIFVRRHRIGVTKGFMILYVDGSTDDVSYLKAIRDIPEHGEIYEPRVDIVSNFKSAMRYEISRQTIDFKIQEWHTNQTCAITGE